MLKIKPNCELCDVDLPPHSENARICTYECTFCANCVDTKLLNVCPNCGGGFTPRPLRPTREHRAGVSLQHHPASQERVNTPYSEAEITEFSNSLAELPPEQR